MKQIIESYGRVIMVIIIALGAVLLIRNAVFSQMKANGSIKDTKHISSNEFFQRQGKPELSGVREEDGTARRIVIKKEDRLNPKLLVTASDKNDGDLTGKIKIYTVRTEEGKEIRSLFESEYLDTSVEKEFTLLYIVRNSLGLVSEGRVKVLVKNYGENHSE
ncbi:hypothetical protein [Anaerostipes sp.]|uniref:hypothetical protein n=1 Tax=Anaerostipes sp. TaxID=1872530 RepID=UPI0025C11C37|nr:hypothetical protein [Anaerostipes sp.]MBS7006962.1 hypothetical protein [Anaerostipes sp.]